MGHTIRANYSLRVGIVPRLPTIVALRGTVCCVSHVSVVYVRGGLSGVFQIFEMSFSCLPFCGLGLVCEGYISARPFAIEQIYSLFAYTRFLYYH